MFDCAIEVKNLTKKFGNFVSVNNISFNVKKGEIFGFLGANGAGKSTTIRMLCGILGPTSGTACVGGYDVKKNPDKVKESIGYMSQKFSLYEDLTVLENINFFGGIYGLSKKKIKEREEWLIETAGLQEEKNRLAGELPSGWKQRLALGCAMLHNPLIIFLDEPTGGVDPVSRRNFWGLIQNLSDSGVTIFVTTHYLDEAEYCHSVALLHLGNLVASDSIEKLKTDYVKSDVWEVECEKVVEAMDIMNNHPLVEETTIFGTTFHLQVKENVFSSDDIKKILNQNKIKVERIEKITPSLEDVFVYLIQKFHLENE